ncbi:right-handed parallel beta-helix repeat-containing protein [Flavihumibacter petaseus]|uniref:Alpha-galactosidase n=1 Tax=Flavihumibacter petaseus NBRC 106054 TaxID=1220578 RepID=A0A0E9N415_9BACT|nr:right-handed parallel beta-helix repeat-containing protein [Flavihumibacter petaseus]GAO44564.1 alpha-galactosidase [Flavihumibacter petaseus NBRC 106054]
MTKARLEINIMRLLALLILMLPVFTMAQEVVRADAFGVRSNSFENASGAIRKAIDFCRGKSNATLLLPGGRIDVWPEGSVRKELYISNATENDTLSKEKNIAFDLADMHDLTIDGNNTLVVLHGKMVSFVLTGCRNVQLKNIRFDYERPTMSEMTLVKVSPNAIEAAIHPDTWFYIDESQRINWYGEGWKSRSYHTILLDTGSGRMHYSSFQPFAGSRAVRSGPLAVRFEGDFSRGNFAAGNVLTTRDPYRDNVGAFINRCANVRLEGITMNYMHGLGIVSQFSEDISLVKVRVAPPEGSGRVISAFADCFHFSGCRGRILLDSCLTSGSHDDPVNVHGTHLKIISISKGNEVTVRFMHHQTYGFEAYFAGDSIALTDPATLLAKGFAVVKTAKLVNRREMVLTLDKDLAGMMVGDCLENLTWTPELTVRNSRFEKTNTRGLLVTTRRKVVIENNVFYRTGMHAILIADDASSWYESGPVQDVIIRNNLFEGCGYNSDPQHTVIAISPENHKLVADRFVHRNITITGNRFNLVDVSVITARSVDGLQFTGNIISGDGNTTGKPSFSLTACKKVEIIGNDFRVGWRPEIQLENMKADQLKADLQVVKK